LLIIIAGFASCKKAGVITPAANNINRDKLLVLNSLEKQKITVGNAFVLLFIGYDITP